MHKHCQKIHEEYYKDTPGMKSNKYHRLKSISMAKPNGHKVYFEICQWEEEIEKGTFDYDYIIIDENDKVIYDESNGEMPIEAVYKKMYEVLGIDTDYYLKDDFCYADDLDIECINCDHCF